MQAAASYLLNAQRTPESARRAAPQPLPTPVQVSPPDDAAMSEALPPAPKGNAWTGALHSEFARQRENTWLGGRADRWWS
jgi:hypothetical protein